MHFHLQSIKLKYDFILNFSIFCPATHAKIKKSKISNSKIRIIFFKHNSKFSWPSMIYSLFITINIFKAFYISLKVIYDVILNNKDFANKDIIMKLMDTIF